MHLSAWKELWRIGLCSLPLVYVPGEVAAGFNLAFVSQASAEHRFFFSSSRTEEKQEAPPAPCPHPQHVQVNWGLQEQPATNQAIPKQFFSSSPRAVQSCPRVSMLRIKWIQLNAALEMASCFQLTTQLDCAG